MKFDRSNKFDLCYYGQVNSLRIKSSSNRQTHLGVTFILLVMVLRSFTEFAGTNQFDLLDLNIQCLQFIFYYFIILPIWISNSVNKHKMFVYLQS